MAKPRKQKREAPKGIRYLDMGPWPVFVGVCADEKAFNREMRRLKVPDTVMVGGRASATTTMLARKGTSLTYIVGLRPDFQDFPWEQVAAILAHEAAHVVQDMRESLSPGDPFGHEAESYIVQYITQEALAFLYKTGRTKAIRPPM